MEEPRRHLYRLKCPQCGSECQYEGTKKGWWDCPICGHDGEFAKFVIEKKEKADGD